MSAPRATSRGDVVDASQQHRPKGEIVEDAPTADFFGKPRSERAQLFLSKILQH